MRLSSSSMGSMRSVPIATSWWALTVVLLLGVTASVASSEDLPMLAERRAKMPNFRDNGVVQEYARGLTMGTSMKDGDKDGGFKMPDSVNHLKVKTNSSDPYKNEKNVTMNLNIPASVSDFLLEEIDLKYVKRPRKKSAGSKKSNSLLIKYFTNRSSNLHLSSVTKEEEPLPDLYPHGDLKERRDESPAQGSSNQVPVRPFRYKQKYPLRLLEKIRSSTNRRTKEREGKAVDDGGTEENVFGDTRPRRSSVELDDGTLGEEDLKALESILVSKTLVNTSFEGGSEAPPTSKDEDVSIQQLYDIFEKAVDETESEKHKDEYEINKDDHKIKKDKHEEANTVTTTPEAMGETPEDTKPQKKGNWFTRTLPSYFLSVIPNSFRSSIFPGSNYLARRRRSTSYEDDYKNGNEMTVTGSITNINGIPGMKDIFRQKSPYLPAKQFSDPRLWLEQSNRVMWGDREQLDQNVLQRPQDNDVPKRPLEDFSPPQSQLDPLSFDDVPSLWMSSSTDTPSYPQQSLGHPTHSHIEGNDLIQSFRPGNTGSSKRLSKLDYYFSTLKMTEEYCRQRALCEVAHEPQAYAPLADMFAQETSVDGDLRTLGRELLGTRDGARLYGYIEATRRGADRSRHACEVYRIRCHVSTSDVIDTNSLAMWREIASWLTVKVLASSSNTRDRH